jgi:hypothetical protein
MNEACAVCTGGLDHCHGTLVVHVDGDLECTDPGCVDPDRVRHDMVVDCLGTLPGCCEPVAAPRLVLMAS